MSTSTSTSNTKYQINLYHVFMYVIITNQLNNNYIYVNKWQSKIKNNNLRVGVYTYSVHRHLPAFSF